MVRVRSTKSIGRIIGILVFLHLATGLMTPYIMLQPLSTTPASDLAVAASMELRIRLAVALLFVGGVIPVAIAITAWPVARERSPALGQWLLVLAGVSLAMQFIENQQFLSLLSLGRELGRAGDSGPVLAVMAPVVRAGWKWAHYTHLLSIVGWMLLFCGVLFRLALVPRALAAAGVLTTIMQLVGITLPVLLGYGVPLRPDVWGVPLGVAYLGLSLWLMARGFPDPATTADRRG